MQSMFRLVVNLPAILAGTALFALMTMTFADVMLRSLFNAPIQYAADLTRVLMTVTVFSVLPVLSARGGHISVDLLDGFFERARLTRWREALVNLSCGIMLIWPTQRVWILAERSRSYGDVMEYLGMPLFYIGWSVALFTALTALVLILRGLAFALRPDLVGIGDA